jgi:selenocysteine lyase/cysteine desulfurase
VDLEGFRAAFPALQHYIWLNSATSPPAAAPVAEALRRVQRDWETGDFAWQAWEADAYATRDLFARLVNAPADAVALTSSVSYGAASVAATLPAGRVVVGGMEFQSNYYPWLALRDRGFEVTVVEPDEHDVVWTDRLIDAIAPDTVLVAISEVQSVNGHRADLAAIVEAAHARGARVFVDACQSLGALRFDVEALPVDYLATHGYKWLLCPRGAAWLYVRPDHLPELRPLTPSWKTVEEPYASYYGGEMVVPENARKLDVSFAWFSWPGAKAALELLHSLDRQAVEERALTLAETFREGARSRGLDVSPVELPSQIVGVVVPDPDELRIRLKEQRVVAAVRGGYLRIGFHGFNDEADVAAGLDALTA